MNPRWRRIGLRLAAAVVSATLGAGLVAAPARAEGETYSPKLCQPYRPVAQVPDQVWQVQRLRLEEVHKVATGKGITVGVIDTGVDVTDMKYFDAKRVKTRNYTGNNLLPENSPYDCGHGTRVVSVLAGKEPSGVKTDFQGVAPDVKVISYRSLQRSERKENEGPEPLAPTIAAVRAAIKDKVDVINISQAGTASPAYADAISAALKAGIVVVAAAGNGGAKSGPSYPAAYPGVIAVGMTTDFDVADPASQQDPQMQVTIGAPGSGVWTLLPSNKDRIVYDQARGSSFAAPMVSGVVALILQRFGHLTPEQVRRRLITTADPPPGAIPDPQLGYGIVNPLKALTAAVANQPSDSPSPTQGPPPPPPVDQRPKPDLTLRNIAIGIAIGSLTLVLAGIVLRWALPRARDRRFQPANPKDDLDPE